ncbi:galactokinase [Streptomyces cinereoruber]|uniref:Galactokinase n=1 Tax=Streptomyces cinereoruber TaxID=67260 RepID=A0AAV4KM07_9ACTN|nr:galactokinase [Streptomyces cinereoruber]MBB4160214.1 galactokinase [Streptomyces cinereoruber]MBY8818178.1 galactokinase [Streptomyces cinereoruber]NIH61151.1 galactokinase [Streptomyces cinereoruber]QEV33154.1 galactokinase [Streptomyces cinereoruber]GGR38930.1 galactokinase [Streptomyces cinereoruber]
MNVATGFQSLYGAAPDGVWAAPGRVNLIGEYTDFNDGFVLPLALPHTAVAAVSRRDDGVLRLHSADVDGGIVQLDTDTLEPLSGGGWAAYPAGVVWALREAGHPVTGADLHLASTVPTGAGLSSSAALEVVTALALNDLFGLGLSRPELARIAQRAENAFVGVPCGIMDQMASACALEGHALHLDTRDLSHRQVPFDPAAEGLTLLVVDTRVKHALGDGAYAERRAGCEAGARALGVRALREVDAARLPDALARLDDETVRRYVRHVVSDNARVERVIALLDAGDPRAVGPVLTEGHASLRDDLRVSCPELDLVVEAANAAGALGARMTGGGFGGSAVVLVGTDRAEKVAAAVEKAFAAAGHAAPGVFPAVPSAGARRVRGAEASP